MNVDPVTNAPLPPNAMQRILYITPKVHVYRIPPISSTKGFNAASWTDDPANQIFTARLRIMETAIPTTSGDDKVSVTLLLEDPSNGQLFAAAPYTHPSAVEQALDSSRFFAIRVVGGGGGQKATLGLGFEERPEAFDFGVTLQDCRRTLGLDGSQTGKPSTIARGGNATATATASKAEVKRDLSLKEGETITINIGAKGRRHLPTANKEDNPSDGNAFAILPPPPSGRSSAIPSSFLPPPPSTTKLQQKQNEPTAEELGFDDGEFGEFQ